MKSKIKRITILSLFTAVSLALFSVELLLPSFSFAPGAKLGLANSVSLFMITNNQFFKKRDCFAVLIARCLLSALLTGRILSISFSLCGGIMAIISMIVARHVFSQNSTIFISISGAVFHNLTQMLVAICLYGTFSAIYYIPALIVVGISSGLVVGLCVNIINKLKIMRYLKKLYG